MSVTKGDLSGIRYRAGIFVALKFRFATFLAAMEFAVPVREKPPELMTPTGAGMAAVGVFLCSIISGL